MTHAIRIMRGPNRWTLSMFEMTPPLCACALKWTLFLIRMLNEQFLWPWSLVGLYHVALEDFEASTGHQPSLTQLVAQWSGDYKIGVSNLVFANYFFVSIINILHISLISIKWMVSHSKMVLFSPESSSSPYFRILRMPTCRILFCQVPLTLYLHTF